MPKGVLAKKAEAFELDVGVLYGDDDSSLIGVPNSGAVDLRGRAANAVLLVCRVMTLGEKSLLPAPKEDDGVDAITRSGLESLVAKREDRALQVLFF